MVFASSWWCLHDWMMCVIVEFMVWSRRSFPPSPLDFHASPLNFQKKPFNLIFFSPSNLLIVLFISIYFISNNFLNWIVFLVSFPLNCFSYVKLNHRSFYCFFYWECFLNWISFTISLVFSFLFLFFIVVFSALEILRYANICAILPLHIDRVVKEF